jgi:hypothetical protein
MKKILFATLMLLAGISHADNEFRFTPNNAGGYIFFTYSTCIYTNTGQRVPNSFYVYSTNKSGQKVTDGCYIHKYPFYLITWNGGGNTSIEVSTTEKLN